MEDLLLPKWRGKIRFPPGSCPEGQEQLCSAQGDLEQATGKYTAAQTQMVSCAGCRVAVGFEFRCCTCLGMGL